jgi:hypothetical protein
MRSVCWLRGQGVSMLWWPHKGVLCKLCFCADCWFARHTALLIEGMSDGSLPADMDALLLRKIEKQGEVLRVVS